MTETKFPYEQEDFSRFAFVADEWLIDYAFHSGTLISTIGLPFSFAMTLELYLKAYYTKLTDDGLKATNFGHRIDKLLKELELIDPTFPDILRFNLELLNYPIFELDKEHWNTKWFNKLIEADKQSLIENYEFYLIMAYGPDLKYGISPSREKHNGRIISSAWKSFNSKLLDIVIEIRSRLEYPLKLVEDNLFWATKNPHFTEESLLYIKTIIAQTKYKTDN